MATDSTEAGTLNKGQSLVAAFRAARMTQRPALRTELRQTRAALRQQRLDRLAQLSPTEAAPHPPIQEAPHDDEALAARPEQTSSPSADSSIFAGFVGDAGQATQPTDGRPSNAGQEAPSAPMPLVTPDAIAEAAAPEAAANDESAPVNNQPLSAIGFGPGMMIRLSQLGVETVADLAAADPVWLRGALGEISRLINVDVWIETARNAGPAAA